METQKKWRYSNPNAALLSCLCMIKEVWKHVCVKQVKQHCASHSCQMLLKELNLGLHKFEFSSLAVSLSLEGKASHRELTSRLLSDLTGKLLSQSEMSRAFDKMLKELPDLILDTPEAPQVQLQQFSGSGLYAEEA